MDITAALQDRDQAELIAVVRRALGTERVEVIEWHAHPLSYDRTSPVSAGVYRVVGTASDGSRSVPWSLVLKVLRSPAGLTMPNGFVIPRDLPDDPGLFSYWKREALAYGENVLGCLPTGIVAPRCYGVTTAADGTVWLWLADLATSADPCWTPDRYGTVARHLGRFNGAYLTGRSLPAHTWLGQGWLRSFLDLPGRRMMDRIPSADAWEHPLILRALSPTVRERVVRLWADREALLAALDSLPHTFCHRDAFRPNLFLRRDADGHKQTVAIDWAFAGAGPVGEEIAPLIAMRPAGGLEPYDPASLERSVFTGYLRGLREAGWRGDERLVRFGYAATAALRYTFLTVAEMQSEAFDESRYAEVERRRGRPIEVVMGRQAALVSYLLGLADEARALLAFVAVGTAPKEAAAGAARAGSRRGPASGGQARNGVERTEQVPATRN